MEYAVVAVLLSVFLVVGAQYYLRFIEHAQRAALNLQADYFRRALETVSLYWQMQGRPSGWFIHQNMAYWLSTDGHVLAARDLAGNAPGETAALPAELSTAGPGTFTDGHCLKLYNVLISAPESATLKVEGGLVVPAGNTVGDKREVKVQAKAQNERKCRFYLMFVEESNYFFDYDANTGQLLVATELTSG